MRHLSRMCVPMIALCLLLPGCGPAGEGGGAEQLALDIRGEYLAMEGCSAQLEVVADYGQRVYEYTVDLTYNADGETVLTVTAPENIAGVTARIQAGETALEYDGARIETGPLNEAGLSPVDAVPALMSYLQQGYIAECGMESGETGELLRLVCREPEGTAGEGLECSLWLDPSTHALVRGELSQDGFAVIKCEFTQFSMEQAE